MKVTNSESHLTLNVRLKNKLLEWYVVAMKVQLYNALLVSATFIKMMYERNTCDNNSAFIVPSIVRTMYYTMVVYT